MVQPLKRLHFCGLDGTSDAALPAYYKSRYGVTEEECLPFSRVLRNDPWDGGLFTAESTSVSWHIPESDKLRPDVLRTLEEEAPDDIIPFRDDEGQSWVRVGNYNATYCPEKLERWFQGIYHDDDLGFINPLWKTTTETYGIINPTDGYGPLEDALREHDLGDAFYGNFRLYDRGGTWYLSGLFNQSEMSVEVEGVGNPVAVGFQSGSDVFGNLAFFAEGFAQDTGCTNSIHAITDKKRRKHVSSHGSSHLSRSKFVEWWNDFFEEMFDLTSDLQAAITDAQDVELDFTELPFDLEEFYELIGFPNGNQSPFASVAKVYAQERAFDRYRPTMWDVHSGATAFLEHEWDHSEGTQFRRYVRLANDLLFNPHVSVERARDEMERRIAEAEGGAEGALTLGGEDALAQVTQLTETLEEQADRWEERQHRLQTKIEMSEQEEEPPEAEA